MFRHNYQGAGGIELFSAKGSDPVGKWKLTGNFIRKEYNKELRGLVYCLEGGCQTVKMQMPANEKMSLGLVQRFLVIQVNVPKEKDFSVELLITDKSQLKRRLYLSTVHKELSTTMWHARIPFTGLSRNMWSTLFIDLVSFAGKLFKDTGFSTLDGICLSATCKVRRIFTMNPDIVETTEYDAFFREAALMDAVPRGCRIPTDVDHQPQVWSMETVGATRPKTEAAAEKSISARSSSHHKTKPQGLLLKTPGCRETSTSSPNGRKIRVHSEGSNENSHWAQQTGHVLSYQTERTNTAESVSPRIKLSKESLLHLEGTSRSIQTRPRKNKKEDSKLPDVKEKIEPEVDSSDPLLSGSRGAENKGEMCSPTTNGKVSRVLTPSEKMEPATVEGFSGWIRQDLSPAPQAWSSWDSNDEPEFTLQDEVFAFKSQPHSPKRRQGHGDQEKMERADECVPDFSGRRYEASPEDDFVGSETDEDDDQAGVVDTRPSTTCSEMKFRSEPEASDTSGHLSKERLAVPTVNIEAFGDDMMVPERCFSPCKNTKESESCQEVERSLDGSSVRLSRQVLREARAEDIKQNKSLTDSVRSSIWRDHSLLLVRSNERDNDDDDDEMRMLASLRREREEEEENQALGLSASQIHRCHVSMSVSSDDNSTWTHISMPANQGCHYQKEMTPLECSDPRQRMELLSPPLIPPLKRSDNSGKQIELQREGADEDEECLNLLYDSCLNCYLDPQTGKYYELA